MKSASLRLTSTSFLLPGNAAWSALAKDWTLTFGGYGDWPAVLMSSPDGPLAWILFLQDLAAPDALAGTGEIGGHLAPILDALRVRLKADAISPIVVAWSSWWAENPIRRARVRTPWDQLGRELEDALYALAQSSPNLFIINLDQQFASGGSRAAFDLRNWYAAHCHLSRSGIEVAARSISAVLRRLSQTTRKVLILDCDNTLWGGVVGEVGLSGLTLGQDGQGQMFSDFQRRVVALIRQGLIVCLASKNNEADVWKVFGEHPGMVLKREQIVAARINWDDKAGNIAAIAAELNLDSRSFVFWDDNPIERERMRLSLPKVLTPELPADVGEWPDFLANMDEFANFTVTEEDRGKVEQYRSAESFAAERRQSGDEVTFLKSISLRPEAVPVSPATLARAVQLCAKTNQFNLRTMRHSEADLHALASAAGNVAFLVHLADRFGDHGLVAFAAARLTGDPQVAFLDTFLLSCRVLGRHLEAWALAHLAGCLRAQGVTWLIAEYRPTEANSVARNFLREHRLVPIDRLEAAKRERLTSACRMQHPGEHGEMFAAALAGFAVPHLEPYAHS